VIALCAWGAGSVTELPITSASPEVTSWALLHMEAVSWLTTKGKRACISVLKSTLLFVFENGHVFSRWLF